MRKAQAKVWTGTMRCFGVTTAQTCWQRLYLALRVEAVVKKLTKNMKLRSFLEMVEKLFEFRSIGVGENLQVDQYIMVQLSHS